MCTLQQSFSPGVRTWGESYTFDRNVHRSCGESHGIRGKLKTGQDGGQRDQIRSLSIFTKWLSNPITRREVLVVSDQQTDRLEALGHRTVQTVPWGEELGNSLAPRPCEHSTVKPCVRLPQPELRDKHNSTQNTPEEQIPGLQGEA